MAVAFGLGVVLGAGLGVFLVRYGLGLGERMAWSAREGVPALSEYDSPLEQAATTDGTEDLEERSDL